MGIAADESKGLNKFTEVNSDKSIVEASDEQVVANEKTITEACDEQAVVDIKERDEYALERASAVVVADIHLPSSSHEDVHTKSKSSEEVHFVDKEKFMRSLEEEKQKTQDKSGSVTVTNVKISNGNISEVVTCKSSIVRGGAFQANKENIQTGKSTNIKTITPDCFRQHLFWPGEPKTVEKKKKVKLPHAISSVQWRSFYSKKDDEKKKIAEEKERRKQNKAKLPPLLRKLQRENLPRKLQRENE